MLQYFPIPKPLPVFVLGPLGNASWAFYCTALSSAFLGTLVYLVARHFFGQVSGLLLSLFLLLDPLKGALTLRSSADLSSRSCSSSPSISLSRTVFGSPPFASFSLP